MNKKKITLSFDLEQVCNDVLAKCNLISMSIRDAALEDIKANVQEPDNPETRSIVCRSITEAFGKMKVACQRYLTVGRTTDDNTLERIVKSVTYVKVQDSDGPLPLYDCTASGTAKVVFLDGVTYKDALTNADVTPDSTPTLKETIDKKIWNATVSTATVEVYKVTVGVSSVWKKVSDNSIVEPDSGTTPTEKMVDGDEVNTIIYETVGMVLEIPNFNTAVTDHLKSMIHKYVVDYVMGRFLQDQLADKAGEYKALADGEDYDNVVKDLNARERYTMRKPSWA